VSSVGDIDWLTDGRPAANHDYGYQQFIDGMKA
jgi:hypothetical protein